MSSRTYPFSSVEEKWQQIWKERPESCSAEKLSELSSVRYILPWLGWAAEGFDWSLLRRLTLADAYARQQRHAGKNPYYAHALEGFRPGGAGSAAASCSVLKEETEALGSIKRSVAIGDDHGAVAVTSDPRYYRFTQWIFLQLLSRDLVFRLWRAAFRCPRCRRTFALEESVTLCPRCSEKLEDREVPEWRVDLLPYAERLFSDVEKSSWSAEARKQQKALIGRRRGTAVVFPVSRPYDAEFEQVEVFTTRVEAIYGVTFLLVAPHHPILEAVVDPGYEEDVLRYQERLGQGMEPRVSGVRSGGFALNPMSLERVPIVVSPLAETPHSDGLVMGVPAHDRDHFELARRIRLPVREVIHSGASKFDFKGKLVEPYLGEGTLTNSGPFNGLNSRSGRERVISGMSRRGMCRKTTRYALRSLPLSTLSLGGPPVPLVHCETCGCVPVPESSLPLELPEIPSQLDRPAVTLELLPEYIETLCPGCGRKAQRDPGVLLPWLGQSWSHLRLPLKELGEDVEGLGPGAADTAPPAEVPADSEGPGVDAGLPEEGGGGSEEPRGESAVHEQEESGGRSDEERATPETPAADGAAAAAPVEEIKSDERAPALDDEGLETGEQGSGEEAPGDRTAAGEKAPPPGSRVKPFRSPLVHRLFPVDIVLAPLGVTPRDLVTCRFTMKFLHDLRQVPVMEPFRRFFRVGEVSFAEPADRPQAERAEAPREHDVSSPSGYASACTEIIERCGGDALRLKLLGLGPAARRARLRAEDVFSQRRFLNRIWKEMNLRIEKGRFVSRRVLEEKHRMIYRVTDCLRRLKFHTALSAIAEFVKFIVQPGTTDEEMDRSALETFAIILSPFAPHLAQELWERLGHPGSILEAPWPEYSTELLTPSEAELTIWVDGKVRDRMTQPVNLPVEKLEALALERDRVRNLVGSRRIRRIVSIPGRLVSIALEHETSEEAAETR